MSKPGTQERLRRAAEFVAMDRNRPCDATQLLEAWEHIKGLNSDDLPAEMHPAFSFLRHEISRATSEELSAREAVFLAEKIRKLELIWLDNSYKGLDTPV